METLKRMNDTMYHRGPNDRGAEIFALNNGFRLGLAQRRLSIFDLSVLGHQPMHSPDGKISVVYNGEIYNFLEIKNQLKEYNFKSNCDTEVIIAAYIKWGITCITRFNGMFAIALYDGNKDDLYLIRDRIGKKPLYYWIDGGNIVFASELKPIIYGFKSELRINRSILKQYMCNGYIRQPNSVFENVYQLLPGNILKYHLGRIEITSFWDAVDQFNINSKEKLTNYNEAKKELSDLIESSVKLRLMADVPVGTFLSGGYDSSLVTAMAQKVSSSRVNTFSIGFENSKYNEAGFAKKVAEYLGTNHTEMYISENDMLKLVDSIPQYYDEPFADPSEIPTMLVSMLAKNTVTVALTGDGGDEFFCGYNRYIRVRQAQMYDGVGEFLFNLCNFPFIKKYDFAHRLPHKIRSVVLNRDVSSKCQSQKEDFKIIIEKMLPSEEGECKYDESKYFQKNWQEQCMLLDQESYLTSLLCKTDRASMKYSLECRCPLLDYRIMEFSYKIPHEFKYTPKTGGKRILKDITYDYIPRELMDRPKKGFGAPIDEWLKTTLKDELLAFSDIEFLKKQGIFHPEYTSEYMHSYISGTGANHRNIVWSFFVFQQWYQFYSL